MASSYGRGRGLEVFGQGLANAGQIFGQGINDYQKEKREAPLRAQQAKLAYMGIKKAESDIATNTRVEAEAATKEQNRIALLKKFEEILNDPQGREMLVEAENIGKQKLAEQEAPTTAPGGLTDLGPDQTPAPPPGKEIGTMTKLQRFEREAPEIFTMPEYQDYIKAERAKEAGTAGDLQAWQARSNDWKNIASIEPGEERNAAELNYFKKWSPSIGYGASPEAVNQAARKSYATTNASVSSKINTESGLSDITNQMRKEEAAASSGGRIKGEFEAKENTPGAWAPSQYLAGGYAFRLQQSDDVLKKLGEGNFNPASIKNAVVKGDIFNLIKNTEQQQYAQAVRNFINADLRRESGAAIAPSEFDSGLKQYFAQMGDKPEVLEQKRQNRRRVFAMMKSEAAGAYGEIQSNYEKDISGGETPAPEQTSKIPDDVVQQALEILSDTNAPQEKKDKAKLILTRNRK